MILERASREVSATRTTALIQAHDFRIQLAAERSSSDITRYCEPQDLVRRDLAVRDGRRLEGRVDRDLRLETFPAGAADGAAIPVDNHKAELVCNAAHPDEQLAIKSNAEGDTNRRRVTERDTLRLNRVLALLGSALKSRWSPV